MKPRTQRRGNAFIKRPEIYNAGTHTHERFRNMNVSLSSTLSITASCLGAVGPPGDSRLFTISNLIFNLEVKQAEVMKGPL